MSHFIYVLILLKILFCYLLKQNVKKIETNCFLALNFKCIDNNYVFKLKCFIKFDYFYLNIKQINKRKRTKIKHD